MQDYGFTRLLAALQARGLHAARRGHVIRCGASWTIATGRSGASEVEQLLVGAGVESPTEPESLCVQQLDSLSGNGGMGGRTLVVYGADERGLLYALLDVARQIELADDPADPLSQVQNALERPALAIRSVFKFYYQTDNDDDWFYSQDFWERYFGMLAASRFNAFTLLYGGDTPLVQYPFLVEVPGYEQVRVTGLPDAERARTLAMLRFISSLATDRGLEFGLAIWGHGLKTDVRTPWGYEGDRARPPHYKYHEVTGLDEASLLPYCAAAINTLLQECPHITRLQLRLNNEAGLPKDELDHLWSTVFAGVAACGRPVTLDLRAKGITDHVIEAGLAVDPTALISTKFSTEHMALPYHPAQLQQRERPKTQTPPGMPPSGIPDGPRYGYGALLRHPLRYRFLFQLWAFGTQRLLSWGDPAYAARFARAATLGGACGFEVGSLLGYQGHWHAPGTYRLLVDPQLDFARWEEERYWYFYLLFGRLGYDSHASPEAWRRELRARFGAAAGAVESAYAAASTVLPLVTSFRTPSAANRQYWPVMDPGGSMEAYNTAEPGDPALFYTIDEYVSEYLRGQLSGKYAPWQVQAWLQTASEAALHAIQDAEHCLSQAPDGEFLATRLDVTIQALLGRYHAARIMAGLEYALHRHTGNGDALSRAKDELTQALRHWQALVDLTDGAYNADLRGFGGQSQHHLAQWAGGLAIIREAVREVEHLDLDRRFPEPAESGSPPWRRDSAPEMLKIDHDPALTWQPRTALPLTVNIQASEEVEWVRLHYRYVNQREPYVVMDMAKRGGHWQAEIPAEYVLPEWDLMYFFTVKDRAGNTALYPGLEQAHGDAPYFVVTRDRAITGP